MSEQEALRAALGKDMLARATADPRQEFGSFFLSRLLGFAVSYEGERCIVSFEAIPTLFNPQGTLHGGILATAMDVSMGHLLRHAYGAGGATLEMKVQYLRPLKEGMARCEARFLQRGRSLAFLESRLYDGEDRLAAMATSTWKPPQAVTP